MLVPDFFNVEFVEDAELQSNTMTAPLSVIREIRSAIPGLAINLMVGFDERVYVSSDLYEAFNVWSSQQTDAESMN
ncbi:hypothetical protein [Planctomyces sp. SH-PL14]|jgi:hypothetical protein|uniref:hypothetical protein n=1 Tax=Planctomyces sp. SH-PL14 TaxID=1632864 RepID=UPI00078D6EC3|nr:hypothetical protein [Planctomyces sp. SH-PL14]AMV21729.1 hypothetical protein VT03_27760 [Planctomyces sp. SH-PL14]